MVKESFLKGSMVYFLTIVKKCVDTYNKIKDERKRGNLSNGRLCEM